MYSSDEYKEESDSDSDSSVNRKRKHRKNSDNEDKPDPSRDDVNLSELKTNTEEGKYILYCILNN